MLNDILKEKRKELNLTQQEIAEQLNVTRQTVSSWEVGKSIPDIATLIEISELYHLSLDYMLKGDKQVNDKIKKDTIELNFLRFFSKTSLIVISILLAVLFPISIVLIIGIVAYFIFFKKKTIQIITAKEPKIIKKQTSDLGQSLTDSTSIIGNVALFYVLVTFLTKNNSLIVEKRNIIMLFVLFIGMTIGRYIRYKKSNK